MLPLIRCLDPEWKRKESHKRRSFLSAVAYDIMKPMIDYRSQSANISHIPTISRAIHARDRRRTSRINVCANERSARNVVDARAAHDLRNRKLSIAAQNASSLCVASTERKPLHTTVSSVHCVCNLSLTMMSEQETIDRASTFRKQYGCLDY